MSSKKKVAMYLVEEKDEISKEVVDFLIKKNSPDPNRNPDKEELELHRKNIGILTETVGKTFFDYPEKVPDELMQWCYKRGEYSANYGLKLAEIIRYYSQMREAFTQIVNEYCERIRVPIEEFAYINNQFVSLMNVATDSSMSAYIAFNDKLLKRAREEAHELSAPIVPIQNEVAVIPLIGTIDSNRTRYLLEKVVPKVSDLKIGCVVADFSGILTLDTVAIENLLKIEQVLSLIGVNVVITGLRPEIAQSVVQLGLDLSFIKAYATVQQALEAINS